VKGVSRQEAAEDIKNLPERHGLNLIAERMDDEKTIVQLLDT
jgi:cyclic-di-GMP phosphodiesterase TipF (flagellum assembly factor)